MEAIACVPSFVSCTSLASKAISIPGWTKANGQAFYVFPGQKAGEQRRHFPVFSNQQKAEVDTGMFRIPGQTKGRRTDALSGSGQRKADGRVAIFRPPGQTNKQTKTETKRRMNLFPFITLYTESMRDTDRQRYTYTLSVTLRFNVGNWKNGEQAQELWGWSLNNWGGREDGRNKAHLAKRQLRGSARSPWPGCREDVWRRVRTQRRWRSSLFLISSFLKSFCVHTCPPKRWRDSFFCIPMQQMIKWLKFKTSKL